LKIFQQHGLTPKERAFQQMLRDLKRLFKRQDPRKCFISYAWEDNNTPEGKAANTQMQQWLTRLTSDLRNVGAEVFFDLDNMHGSLRETMCYNISHSDYFLILCTPRWKQKIEAGLTPALKDCMENNLMAELEVGLRKVDSNAPDKEAFEPKNNAAFEFVRIWAKAKATPNLHVLILLRYMGEMEDATLPFVRGELIRSATKVHQQDEEYYNLLVSLSDPLGLIPDLYRLRYPEQKSALKEYRGFLDSLKSKHHAIDLEMKLAELQVRTNP